MGINLEQLRLEILDSSASQSAIRKCAVEILAEHVEEFKKEFDSSKVTKEIEDGPTADNISGTLDGERGNLFTFIGFKDSANPIQPVRDQIAKIKLGDKKSSNARESTITFKVEIPDDKAFKDASKSPWETGRSWLYDIETRMSGLGAYFYKRWNGSSRGTYAFQAKTEVRGTFFKPVDYFPTMLEKFIKSLK